MTEEEIEIVARAIQAEHTSLPVTRAHLDPEYVPLARAAITALDQHREGKGLVTIRAEPTDYIMDAFRSAGQGEWIDSLRRASPTKEEES